MDFASKRLCRCVAGLALGFVVLWLVLLCLAGFSVQKASVLGGLFLAFPFLRLYSDVGLGACLETAMLLGGMGGACWMVDRFVKGAWQFPLFAAVAVLYGFCGAYMLSVHALV